MEVNNSQMNENNVCCDASERWSGSQRGNRAKEGLLPPPSSLRTTSTKCGGQEKQPFTDRYWVLPPNLSNHQTISQFCPFLWISLTSSSDHDAVRWDVFIWLISCLSQTLTHVSSRHLTPRIVSLQCTDEREIFCNQKQMSCWSWKESDDCSAFPWVGGQDNPPTPNFLWQDTTSTVEVQLQMKVWLGWKKCSYRRQKLFFVSW